MENKEDRCPICDAADVRERTYSKAIVHRGAEHFIEGLKSLECQACGASYFGAGHTEHNKRLMQEGKSLAIHGIGPEWISAFRKKNALSQGDAGKLFGGGKIAFSRYESGRVVPSQALAKLLLVADRVPGALSELFVIADVEGPSGLMSPDQLLEIWAPRLRASGGLAGVLQWWHGANEDKYYCDIENAA